MIIAPSPDVDLSKKDDFLEWVPLSSDMHEINPSTRQQFNTKFKHYSILDQTSMFNEPEKRLDYFQQGDTYIKSFVRDADQVHCPASAIGNKALCQPYLEMKYTSSNSQENITRLYPSLLRSLSEIGGFTELIMLSVGVVYAVYNAWFSEMRSFLVRHVFGRDGKSKCCPEQKKGYGKVIEDNLDIVEVMKELNGLRMLNRAIFKDHHLALLPEVLTHIKDEESREEKSKQEIAKKEVAKRRLSDNKISPLKSKKIEILFITFSSLLFLNSIFRRETKLTIHHTLSNDPLCSNLTF